MRILYTLGIRFYHLAVMLAAAFGHTKASQMAAGWRRVFSDIPTAKLSQGRTLWFHVSSMGEFEQARPVIESFKKEDPQLHIVVSFFSPSGYEVRKNYDLADYVCYLPIDTPSNARRFVEAINPDIVYFVKYDFWYNYMKAVKQHGAKMYIFSTIFRPSQYFFKWYGSWFRRQLRLFDHIFVQNQESLQLLSSIGLTRVSVAGDTRFDRVNDITQAARRFPEIEAFIGNAKVFMAGSSWEPDEEKIERFRRSSADNIKFIIAPHMIHEEHIQKIISTFGSDHCVRFTRLTPSDYSRQVLIIDTMGMLSAMYRYAHVAYIGGGFGQGIHNILEAMTFGKPVIFGPNYHKFKEAVDILALGGGCAIHSADDLIQHAALWFSDDAAYTQAAAACRQYVEDNLGATNKIRSQQ